MTWAKDFIERFANRREGYLPARGGYLLLLASILVLGVYTRTTGFDRGASDFVLPERANADLRTEFYTFHPDERTLIEAALALWNPLHPPLTVYGMLPLYLLRGSLSLFASLPPWSAEMLGDPAVARRAYHVARTLSILVSCLTLVLIWWLGLRLFDRWVAGLGALLAACAPLAIQLAHFYTVDGLFTLMSLAACAALLVALENSDRRWYILCGILIGGAAAVRLNGLLLGGVLLIGHLLRQRDWRSLLQSRLWLAGGAALLTLAALQPFLVAQPSLLLRAESTDDLAYALRIARGEVLVIWSLADLHTLPYLHHWRHLWPQVVGWPLTLSFAAGIGYALWRREWRSQLVLVWCGIYFLTIGGLHAKPVRYLLPLLPFLCLLAAAVGAAALKNRRYRLVGALAGAAVLLYTTAYGLAFSSIYTREDSRIQAGRWIAAHLPAGSRIGVERGAFAVTPLISQKSYNPLLLGANTLFESRGYLTCRAGLAFLQGRLQDLEYIAITDANRHLHFAAAPCLSPAMTEFYAKLVNGELGFDLVRRFKVYPSLGGLQWQDDSFEPTFLGFDHPAVSLLARRSPQAVEQALARWRDDLEENPCCTDRQLADLVGALEAGELETVLERVQTLVDRHPNDKLGHLFAAEVYRRQGRSEARNRAHLSFLSGYEFHRAFFLPWASGMSLVELGLPELAVGVVAQTGEERHYPSFPYLYMADLYVMLGDLLRQRDRPDLAESIFERSLQTHENTIARNRLAYLAAHAGDYPRAAEHWERSLALAEAQPDIHVNLGKLAARYLEDPDGALYHLRRALQLDPKKEAEVSPWIRAIENGLEASPP